MLSRSDILSKNELKKVRVPVPAMGGDVYVSEMSAERRDQWEQHLIGAKAKGPKIINGRAMLIVFTVVDDKGNPLFAEADIPAIGKLGAQALDPIVEQAQKLNGLGADIDDIKKN